jgi:hypothetical protein
MPPGSHPAWFDVADARASVDDDPNQDGWEDPMRRRQFIGAMAGVAVGSATTEDLAPWLAPDAMPAALPLEVTADHVAMVRRVTELHRRTDLYAGGGAVAESATGYLRWACGLLHAKAVSDKVGRELRAAVGYLHNVAGWVAHDLGQHAAARRLLTRGLALAREVDEYALMADAYYKLGRTAIDHGEVQDALRLWQIGRLVAGQAGSPASLALLHANEAWGYGLLGDAKAMTDAFARAEVELGRAGPPTVPRWCRFFTQPAELAGLRYGAFTAIATHRDHRRYAAHAVDAAEQAGRSRRSGDARSYTFDLIAAATGHLLDGNLDQAADYADRAVNRASQLRSARPTTRLARWAAAAGPHTGRHSNLADVAHRAAALAGAA